MSIAEAGGRVEWIVPRGWTIAAWRYISSAMTLLRRLLCLLAPLALLPTLAQAEDPVRLFAAGSLTGAFTDMVAAFGAPAGSFAPPVFGPSGVLRQRIEAGAPADLFASADLASPRKLAAARGLTVTIFTRNSLCVQGRQQLGLTPETVLDRMLDPKLVLATSTPKADPGGDYAWAAFARADQVRPGARALLEGKAKALVGGAGMTPVLAGHSAVGGLFLTGAADLFLGYCSNVDALLAEVPGLVSVKLPPPLAPQGAEQPEYGMVLLSPSETARRFAAFVLSAAGQTILARYGFAPLVPGS